MSYYWNTIKVCQDCMLHHHNGECGGCHSEHGHDCEPWSIWEGDGQFIIFPGLRYSEHAEDCENHHPEGSDTTQASGNVECGCEEDTYSTSQCEGCGSYLHGERYAFTVFHV